MVVLYCAFFVVGGTMEVKIDNNICNFNYDENNNIYECNLIRDSWKNNLNNQLIEERLRNPQKGALYALKSSQKFN